MAYGCVSHFASLSVPMSVDIPFFLSNVLTPLQLRNLSWASVAAITVDRAIFFIVQHVILYKSYAVFRCSLAVQVQARSVLDKPLTRMSWDRTSGKYWVICREYIMEKKTEITTVYWGSYGDRQAPYILSTGPWYFSDSCYPAILRKLPWCE